MTSNLAEIDFYLTNNNVSGFEISLPSSSTRASLHRTNDKTHQAGTSFLPKTDEVTKAKTANFDKKGEQKENTYEETVTESIAKYEQRLRKMMVTRLAGDISRMIQNDEFVDGEISQSEAFIRDLCVKDELDYVTDALMELYSVNLSNPHMLEGILLMVSSVPFEMVAPDGQVMAMGLLSNRNLSVRDRAIQCFERWNSKKGLVYLKNLDCHPKWLQKYVDKVIMYIERDGLD